MITRPINKAFKVNNTWYNVKLNNPSHSCIGCILYRESTDTCEKDLSDTLNDTFGTCAFIRRDDDQNVIFVKVKEQ